MKTILFIEDESALQKTLGDFLREQGFEVISALNGEDGLKLAKAKNPDLILLDLILPKMGGFEVLKTLKETNETKEIPVIVLTNLESMEDIDKALSLGATTYLVKASYSLEEVAEKIRQALSLK
jgi:DNA-binding response OmpR family regulator